MNGGEEQDGEALSASEEQELKGRLRPPGTVPRGSQCPDEEPLRLVAAGLAGEAETDALLAHAATCVWCGRVLRETAEDLGAPPSEEELAIAAKSRLGDADNRSAFAGRLAESAAPVPMPRPALRSRRWGAAVAMAAAISALGVFLWPASPEQLLARAYTEYRSMEIRLPGAAYGPVRTVRKSGTLPILESPDLHEAEARILRGIAAHPDDPKWLHFEGRMHLLTGKPDEAIAELERAHALRPNDAYILSDLGAAWFQKAGQAADHAGDLRSYSSAFEFFSQSARLKPDDPALVFNRALAAEHIFAYNVARDAWEAYVRLDATSAWAREARDHLDKVKKNWTGSGNTPPVQPPMR